MSKNCNYKLYIQWPLQDQTDTYPYDHKPPDIPPPAPITHMLENLNFLIEIYIRLPAPFYTNNT